MVVRIRLKRLGRRHRPYYRVCAMDGHAPRNGKVIEELGHYDPMIGDTDARAVLNGERIAYWLSVGAQPSDKVGVLIKKYGVEGTHLEQQQVALERLKTEKPQAPPPEAVPKPEEVTPEEGAAAEETSDEAATEETPAAEEAAAEESDPSWFDDTIEQKETARVIDRAIKKMPEKFREVVILKIWSELTFAQIAETLDIPLNTAASRYRYGLEILKQDANLKES